MFYSFALEHVDKSVSRRSTGRRLNDEEIAKTVYTIQAPKNIVDPEILEFVEEMDFMEINELTRN